MNPDTVLVLLKLLFAAAAVVAIVAVVVRPLWRMLREKPDVALQMPDITALEEEESELQIPEEGGVPDRQGLLAQARSDPQHTALLVQRWLRERR